MKTKNFFMITGLALFGMVAKAQTPTTIVPSSTTTLHGGVFIMNTALTATPGSHCVFIGANSGLATTAAGGGAAGASNTFVGSNAGSANTGGYKNVAVGSFAGSNLVNGHDNTYLGAEAGLHAAGFNNIFVGSGAGKASGGAPNTGYQNCYIGVNSGVSNTSGINNFFGGNSAGYGNSTGSSNVYLGFETGKQTNGSGNLFLGYQAGFPITSGSSNIMIGGGAGWWLTPGAYSNRLMIGNMIDGDMSTRIFTFNANTNSSSRIRILSSASGISGLNFPNLDNTFTPASGSAGVTNKVLTVNSTGDVILQYNSNLYTADGTIDPATTASGIRTVSMGNTNIVFNTTGSTTNGRIYIGSTPTGGFQTSTGDYRLYVEGGILTEKVKVALRSDTTNWADYVFADDYKLMPLSEVEAFVKENKHLPGVASAEELSKTGLDLGAMQAKQMEKIEELTLHLIEQDKMLESQKQQLQKQSKEIDELKSSLKILLETK